MPIFLGHNKLSEESVLVVVALDQFQDAVGHRVHYIILRHNKRDIEETRHRMSILAPVWAKSGAALHQEHEQPCTRFYR